MISKTLTEVLKFVAGRLSKTDVNWALTGSLALALRGIKVKPRDIDITTTKNGAYKISRLFKEYETELVKFKRTDEFASYYGKLKIKGILVEIIGNFKRKLPDDSWTKDSSLRYKEIINFHGLKIPVLNLNYEYKFYSESKDQKRINTARKIEKFLKWRPRTEFCISIDWRSASPNKECGYSPRASGENQIN